LAAVFDIRSHWEHGLRPHPKVQLFLEFGEARLRLEHIHDEMQMEEDINSFSEIFIQQNEIELGTYYPCNLPCGVLLSALSLSTDAKHVIFGGRSNVVKGKWQGRDVALKIPRDDAKRNYMDVVNEIRALRSLFFLII
jgi:hypothetical protein